MVEIRRGEAIVGKPPQLQLRHHDTHQHTHELAKVERAVSNPEATDKEGEAVHGHHGELGEAKAEAGNVASALAEAGRLHELGGVQAVDAGGEVKGGHSANAVHALADNVASLKAAAV